MIRSMAKDPIVFALANPEPEISPDKARAAGAAIAASGRFDFPNHCNNVLAFPGLMRGALDAKARAVTVSMCLAASRALAELGENNPEQILPSPLDPNVHAHVAEATAMAALDEGLAQANLAKGQVHNHTLSLVSKVASRQTSLDRTPPSAPVAEVKMSFCHCDGA
jgi:malate dehydrogenase (oxaloacetate-decarboxylating)